MPKQVLTVHFLLLRALLPELLPLNAKYLAHNEQFLLIQLSAAMSH